MEVWHEGKHVSLAQHPLPPGVVSSLVPHLVMVAAVCIEHLGHVTWGRGIQNVGERMSNAHASLNRLDNVNTSQKHSTAKIIRVWRVLYGAEGVSTLNERIKQARSHGQLSLNQELLILVI